MVLVGGIVTRFDDLRGPFKSRVDIADLVAHKGFVGRQPLNEVCLEGRA